MAVSSNHIDRGAAPVTLPALCSADRTAMLDTP